MTGRNEAERTIVLLTSILNYRTPDMTLRAVAHALEAMEGLGGEILVVDNCSGDGSYEWLRDEVSARGWDADNRVRVLASPRNGGFGAGHNLAITTGLSDGSRPDYVYILNSDAFPAPDAIRRLHDTLEADPGIGMAGSYIHGSDGVPHNACFRFPSVAAEFENALRLGVVSRLLNRSIVALPVPEETTEVDWVSGASMILRREVLDQIGLFDETFFLYFEETDLCRRAREAGWRIAYVRESSVEHIGSVSTGMKGWERVPGYYLDSRLHYFVKSHGPLYATVATFAYTVGAVADNLRDLVNPRPNSRAKGYVRDMLVHHSRAAGRGLGRKLGLTRSEGGINTPG